MSTKWIWCPRCVKHFPWLADKVAEKWGGPGIRIPRCCWCGHPFKKPSNIGWVARDYLKEVGVE